MEYNAGDIKILEGLDAVRMRPGMYIGTTGSKGMHHLLWEIIDNAIDEVANGYADHIWVTLHPDNSASVEDNGRGMPVGIHPQKGISAVEVIFTQLHAGGKFDAHNYKYSGGLHGVGASVVNALSEWTKVEVYHDYKIYRCEFASYYDANERRTLSGVTTKHLQECGKTHKKGSLVTFKPDKTVFDMAQFNYETIKRRLKELSFLNGGMTVTLTDERIKNEAGQSKTVEYCFNGGISDYVQYLNEEKETCFEKPIFIEGEKDGIYCAAAIQYTDSYTESIFSFVNNIPTTEGGTHETGFKAALTKVLNDYARKNEVLKEKDANFQGEDFREGITVVLNVKMQNIQFEGQTKTKLGNVEARPAVEAIVSDKLAAYLDDLKNSEAGAAIMEKAVQASRVREAARKAKDLARKRSSLEGAPLVGKLSSCTGRKPEENELFIVEGDSAGGTAKQGRDRRFQAILPLRGKPLNVEKKRLDQVLANDEFRSIITALGTSIDVDFDISSLKYHKVVILADADQDGAHIRAILLTFFYRYMRPLITDGHVFIGVPPLYKLEKSSTKETVYVYDDAERAAVAERMGRGYTIQRYKGLGEMSAEQLFETTMNPATRTLVQVSIEDAAEAEHLVTVLMGDKADVRKQYIIEHANFNKEDLFAKEKGVQ
ncbi:MAG: type IIA DNA topoisomerase subunit B [Clostridiales bacterium]|nr:type IIA DNA topoisomerase subunit B [Clostridiales bacterium]